MDDFSAAVAAMIQSDEFVGQTAFPAQCFDRKKYGVNMIAAVAPPAGAWIVSALICEVSSCARQ